MCYNRETHSKDKRDRLGAIRFNLAAEAPVEQDERNTQVPQGRQEAVEQFLDILNVPIDVAAILAAIGIIPSE